MSMATITATTTADPVNGFFAEGKITVVNGVADAPPSFFDHSDYRNGIHDNPEWCMAVNTIKNADRLLGTLNECNYPSLQDRWTLHKAIQVIRGAADALEREIADQGLWISKAE